MKIILQFDDLKIGPMNHFQYILPTNITTTFSSTNRRRRTSERRRLNGGIKFDPIYILSTTFDKRLVIYKLYDSSRSELLLDCNLGDSLIPSVSLLTKNRSDYEMMHSIFGNDDELNDLSSVEEEEEMVITKKRRLSMIREKYDNRMDISGTMKSKQQPLRRQQEQIAYLQVPRHSPIDEDLDSESDDELFDMNDNASKTTNDDNNDFNEVNEIGFK
ncbi:hypothetical protein JA1_001671 [Spathaspora sp. JA1]|nr:hypothetical protein JA1_001671 [Spathaspora sp. JA1]